MVIKQVTITSMVINPAYARIIGLKLTRASATTAALSPYNSLAQRKTYQANNKAKKEANIRASSNCFRNAAAG